MRKRLRPLIAAALVVGSAGMACVSARASDWSRFAGTWTITGSQIAPWAPPTHPARSAESKRLAGKKITFTTQRVAAPSPMGCAKPRYTVQVVRADMIFEGMLAEASDSSPGGAAAATARAGALGFDDP